MILPSNTGINALKNQSQLLCLNHQFLNARKSMPKTCVALPLERGMSGIRQLVTVQEQHEKNGKHQS
jgi:hypothetical protein